MKTGSEKNTGALTRTSRGVRRPRGATLRVPALSGKGSDRQIEEIERTFSLRYEW